MARPEPEIPEPYQEHVEECCWEYQLRVTNQYEEENVEQYRCQWILPVADVSEPFAHSNQAWKHRDYPEEVCFAPPHAPHVRVNIKHVLYDLFP